MAVETGRAWASARQKLASHALRAGASVLEEGDDPQHHLHVLVIKAESELQEVLFFLAEKKLLQCIYGPLSACQLLNWTFESPHAVFSPDEQKSSLSG